MSIEKLLEDLTEAVKDLTAQIEVLTQGLATIPETALPTSSSTIELPVVELSTDAAASSVASSESAPPQETPPEPKRKRGRPPKAKTAEVEPEAEAPQYETYEDAIRAIKDSFAMETLEARQDLVRYFKQDARKLIDLQPLGDDIWKRVIAHVRDMEREAQWEDND